MAFNDYLTNNLDISFYEGFGLSKYIRYSDGSVRIQYLWIRKVTNADETVNSTAQLPFNIDMSKYYNVTITQMDIPGIWSFDASYILKTNSIDVHIRSKRADTISRLIVDIFAFI